MRRPEPGFPPASAGAVGVRRAGLVSTVSVPVPLDSYEHSAPLKTNVVAIVSDRVFLAPLAICRSAPDQIESRVLEPGKVVVRKVAAEKTEH
jgi:hypothetical protein